eukprot:5151028-Lingulodinium_polyedra.AAC.1
MTTQVLGPSDSNALPNCSLTRNSWVAQVARARCLVFIGVPSHDLEVMMGYSERARTKRWKSS